MLVGIIIGFSILVCIVWLLFAIKVGHDDPDIDQTEDDYPDDFGY